jgi:hypothetical protein
VACKSACGSVNRQSVLELVAAATIATSGPWAVAALAAASAQANVSGRSMVKVSV